MASLDPQAISTDPTAPQPGQRYGEVFDRGYKHYDGPRLGRVHAIWRLIIYSIKRAMGIKKSWTAKVIPFVLYISVAIPVAVGVGLRAFVDDADIFNYVGFYSFIFLIEGIFVATIAPEMLSGDRRENVLALYFSRAITRIDYLVAKLVATAILTTTISLVPVAIYWLGVQLLEDSPLSAMSNRGDEFGAILVSGVLIALFLGSVGLLVSAYTDRKAIAVAVIIVGFLVSTSIAYALLAALDGEIERFTVFLSPADTIQGLTMALFDQREVNEMTDAADWPAWVYIAEMLGVSAIAYGAMYLRYRPNE